MRSVLNIFICAVVASIFMTGCDNPKEIPPDKMAAILKECALTTALVKSSHRVKDSVKGFDLYTAIVEKHGYTIEDIRYSVNKMVSRKSDVLEQIIINAKDDINRDKEIAQFLYDILNDSKDVVSNMKDTIYNIDTTLIIKSANSVGKDSIYLPFKGNGEYQVIIEYASDSKKSIGFYESNIYFKDSITPAYQSYIIESESYFIPIDSATIKLKFSVDEGENVGRLMLFEMDKMRYKRTVRTVQQADFKLTIKNIKVVKEKGYIDGITRLISKQLGVVMPHYLNPATIKYRPPYLITEIYPFGDKPVVQVVEKEKKLNPPLLQNQSVVDSIDESTLEHGATTDEPSPEI